MVVVLVAFSLLQGCGACLVVLLFLFTGLSCYSYCYRMAYYFRS